MMANTMLKSFFKTIEFGTHTLPPVLITDISTDSIVQMNEKMV